MDHALAIPSRSDRIPGRRAASTWPWFALLVVAELAIAWISSQLLLNRETLLAMGSGQLDLAQVDRMLQTSLRFQWLGFAAVLPAVALRSAFSALVLQLSLLFLEDMQAAFGQLFRAVIFGQ
jgi:hypothetical protein